MTMSEGPLGFPRLTDFGPFTSTSDEDIKDNRLKQSVQGFDPDITFVDHNLSEPWSRFEGENADEGLTGLWFPESNIMIIEPRHTNPHGSLYELSTMGSGGLEANQPVLPWSSIKSRDSILSDGGWYVDIPASASTLVRSENVEGRIIGQDLMNEGSLWPIMYTVWLSDHPHNSSVTYAYTDSRTGEMKQENFKAANGYRELSFGLGGLPEPKVNRAQFLD